VDKPCDLTAFLWVPERVVTIPRLGSIVPSLGSCQCLYTVSILMPLARSLSRISSAFSSTLTAVVWWLNWVGSTLPSRMANAFASERARCFRYPTNPSLPSNSPGFRFDVTDLFGRQDDRVLHEARRFILDTWWSALALLFFPLRRLSACFTLFVFCHRILRILTDRGLLWPVVYTWALSASRSNRVC
jgi:hypothetical protein